MWIGTIWIGYLIEKVARNCAQKSLFRRSSSKLPWQLILEFLDGGFDKKIDQKFSKIEVESRLKKTMKIKSICAFFVQSKDWENQDHIQSLQVEAEPTILFTCATCHYRWWRVIPQVENLIDAWKRVVGFPMMKLEDSLLLEAWWTLRWCSISVLDKIVVLNSFTLGRWSFKHCCSCCSGCWRL